MSDELRRARYAKERKAKAEEDLPPLLKEYVHKYYKLDKEFYDKLREGHVFAWVEIGTNQSVDMTCINMYFKLLCDHAIRLLQEHAKNIPQLNFDFLKQQMLQLFELALDQTHQNEENFRKQVMKYFEKSSLKARLVKVESAKNKRIDEINKELWDKSDG